MSLPNREKQEKQDRRERLFKAIRDANGVALYITADGQNDDGEVSDYWIVWRDGSIPTPGNEHKSIDILKRPLTPTMTIEDAVTELGGDLVDIDVGIDWVNNSGGRVGIVVDLQQTPPTIKVTYDYRICIMERAGVITYDALSLDPIHENYTQLGYEASYLPSLVTEGKELLELQSDWDDAEEECVTDTDKEE